MRAILSPIVGASGHSAIKAGDWYLDASGRNQVRRHNFAATRAPTANGDSGEGYSVGSLWVDVSADVAYVCLDASQGTAVWRALLSGNGSAGHVPKWAGSHSLEDSPISCSGSDVALAGAISAIGTVAGSHLQHSSLTNNRVVYVGAGGLLMDSPGLEYDGTRLRVTANDPAGTGILDLKYALDGGAASIAWINSSGTRLRRIGGGIQLAQSELSFDEGTTSRLYLRSGGNVGIGTTDPQERVHDAGTVYAGHLKDSSLTSGRVVCVSTGGQLADSADLTFAGGFLTAPSVNIYTEAGSHGQVVFYCGATPVWSIYRPASDTDLRVHQVGVGDQLIFEGSGVIRIPDSLTARKSWSGRVGQRKAERPAPIGFSRAPPPMTWAWRPTLN